MWVKNVILLKSSCISRIIDAKCMGRYGLRVVSELRLAELIVGCNSHCWYHLLQLYGMDVTRGFFLKFYWRRDDHITPAFARCRWYDIIGLCRAPSRIQMTNFEITFTGTSCEKTVIFRAGRWNSLKKHFVEFYFSGTYLHKLDSTLRSVEWILKPVVFAYM